MNRLRKYYPLLFVTITGAVVMGLEILGTRVIGTVYGTSMYVWGALITTTLVCLAVGYAVGGFVADRWPRDWVLYILTVLAGCASLAIPATQGILEPCFQLFGPRAGALVSAFIIFAAPLTLLGVASPYVVRLQARSINAMGRTAGWVFALSTAGSVAGTLLTSFYLIPLLGTRWALATQAGALILIAGGGLLVSIGVRGIPALAVAVLIWPMVRTGAPVSAEVLYRTESPYGQIAVVEPRTDGQPTYRMLFNNGIMQTGMPLDIAHRDRTSLLRTDSYYLEMLPYFHFDPEEPRSCLLIGLAGGLFPRVMQLYPVDVTAVEIDIKIAELAQAYFGYPGQIYYPDGREHLVDLDRFPSRQLDDQQHVLNYQDETGSKLEEQPYNGRIIIQDGRRFLYSSKQRYDFIVLVAYNADTIPFHLITQEMFTAAREHLTDDGILAINYIGGPIQDEVTDSLARTLSEVFGSDRVSAYRSSDDPEAVQVIYFFAFRGLMLEPSLPTSRWSSGADQVDRLVYEFMSRCLSFSPERGTVITDDLNPIDVARVRIAMDWRIQMLSLFGKLKLHRF